MCELLGMSANIPTDICFSFSGLMVRGGQTAAHKDGFGVTFYEDKGCRTFKDALPSCQSEIAKLIKQYPIKSCCVISHIRQANRGRVSLENTHPFSREMWGRDWTFAHNGQLKGIKLLKLSWYQPVGTTDSEHAFCWLLSRIKDKYPNKAPRDMKTLFRYVDKLAAQLNAMGIANFFLSDGRYLYCHCSNNLHWITRRAPFGVATLQDVEMTVDFKQETTPNDVVTVIATKPLTTNEHWHQMQSGESALFNLGELTPL
ncbi:class II glutamine amidotransferase [Saccharobesus litoralis]|uniref:Class II glutamine amidotransferase n=1 Tax=Saccharobesus litoralis TaxID=2172099 RepID=A0A2S0VX54_9ALTE|nr:class II glutamine amidotransferase [Saccharobesus litoralis]AWB68778.1 class II glutamine amidotransferase [Saccharobesus litoralis]